MTKRSFKRLALGTGSVFLVLVLVLVVHIYMVTRRTPPDMHTIAMARINFDEPMNQQDAGKVTAWLYGQKGIDHVLCNPAGRLVVFTYHPVSTDPESIAHAMQQALPYKAYHFIPDAKAMADGCPVAKTSLTYKVYRLFQ